MSKGAYGCGLDGIAEANDRRTLELRLFQKAPFAITRTQKAKSNGGYITSPRREDADLVGLPLGDVPEHPYWVEGRHQTFPFTRAGQINF